MTTGQDLTIYRAKERSITARMAEIRELLAAHHGLTARELNRMCFSQSENGKEVTSNALAVMGNRGEITYNPFTKRHSLK